MPNLPDKIHRAILDHTVDLHRVSADIARQVQDVLTRLAQELAADIVDSGLDTPRTDWQRARLQALSRLAQDRIDTAYQDITDLTNGQYEGLAETTAAGVVAAVNEALGGDLLKTPNWTPEYLTRLVDGTMINGAPSAEWWSRQSDVLAQNFQDQMRMGLLRGESITDLRNRIMEPVGRKDLRLKENRPAATLIRQARRNAEALVRTSAISVANAAHEDAYRANADVLDGETWAATLDIRTCLECGQLDGRTWAMDDTSHPIPALHWNCRCILVPATKSFEALMKQFGGNSAMGKVLDDIIRANPSSRASMGGQIGQDVTYMDWFKGLSERRQIEILGPGKFELWKSGQVTMRQMLDQRGNELTLSDLRAKLGLGS